MMQFMKRRIRKCSVLHFILLLLGHIDLAQALSPLKQPTTESAATTSRSKIDTGHAVNNINRRELFHDAAAVAAAIMATGLSVPFSNEAVASSLLPSTSAPIGIIGASGRTGALCVTACLNRGIPVRALTRSGSWDFPVTATSTTRNDANNPLLTAAACDVKDLQLLTKGIQGCSGVIYAASASKKGGNAKEIDNEGVIRAGNICLAENISRYVVISSTATTRPNSLGYKFTNVLGGIMDEKRLGEEGVQNAYSQKKGSGTPSYSYTVIRPGGLEEPKKNEILGPKALEISQGDVLAGIISRADLAEVAVELALSNAPNLRNTALELYYTDSAQPCERQFKSMMSNNGLVPRLHGNTYEELFEGIQPGIDYYIPS